MPWNGRPARAVSAVAPAGCGPSAASAGDGSSTAGGSKDADTAAAAASSAAIIPPPCRTSPTIPRASSADPRHDEEARLLPAREEARQHLRGGVLVAVVEGEHHRVPRELPRAVVRVEDLAKRDGLEPLRTEEVEMGVQLVRGDRQRFSPVAHRVVHEDGYALAARGAEGRAEEQRCLRTRHSTRTYHFPPADALSGPRSRR